ncbi:hypothetical protein [Sedimentibacter sp.]|uniref:hypothetical protein n=1 Tax=Sedimentibacter sp. TaxID=1960295 RepID=UPI0028A2011E|nr:hypothetical protein [Sedimentibacter sp.]
MKIKIKVKTLILFSFLILLTFVWGIPTAILSIANLFGNNTDTAALFYEKYASYPTTSKVKGGYLYADSRLKGFPKFSIFLDGWGGGNNISPEEIEKVKNMLEDAVKKTPKSSEAVYYTDSYRMLLDLLIDVGDAEALKEWISFGQDSADEKIVYISDIYNAFYMHVKRDREAAKKIIAKYEGSELADVNFEILKAEIELFDGNYEKAKQLYSEVNNISNYWMRRESAFGSGGYLDRSFWFEYIMDDFRGDNVVTGTVTFEGKPMPFVEIYVQKADGSLHGGGESYIGITDENGEFETMGLRDGLYSIGIGIDSSVLSDKVLQRSNQYTELAGNGGRVDFTFRKTFDIKLPEPGQIVDGEEFTVSWEEVEGAVYYTVDPVVTEEPYKKSGTSFRSPANDKNGNGRFTANYAVFDVSMLRNQFIMRFGGDGTSIEPLTVLGAFLPGAEYPIVVNAYDSDNNLITSSVSMRSYYENIPSVIVEGKLTKGEEMILKRDYAGAINYYEDILKNNPDDMEALKYLTRIYGTGWRLDMGNLEKAYKYGKRYGDITGDNKMLIKTFDIMSKDEIKENIEIVKMAVEQAEDDIWENKYYFLSRYYIVLGDYEAAREVLEKSDTIVDTLAYLNMYFGDYDKAAENLQSKSYYRSRLVSDKVVNAVRSLAENPPSSRDVKSFNDFLLKLIYGVPYEKGQSLYDETVKQIDNENIREILYEIYLENHWYDRYSD